MKILLAYSSKTKNTKKVALEIYNTINEDNNVTLFDIKKGKILKDTYDLYILGCWVDKATANKNMVRFIENNKIENKKTILFMTCGVPKEHEHAKESRDNFKKAIEENNNEVLSTFICQGKIDPKIILVFKFLTWRNPDFIHKVDDELLKMVEDSKTHPDSQDLHDAREWIKTLL